MLGHNLVQWDFFSVDTHSHHFHEFGFGVLICLQTRVTPHVFDVFYEVRVQLSAVILHFVGLLGLCWFCLETHWFANVVKVLFYFHGNIRLRVASCFVEKSVALGRWQVHFFRLQWLHLANFDKRLRPSKLEIPAISLITRVHVEIIRSRFQISLLTGSHFLFKIWQLGRDFEFSLNFTDTVRLRFKLDF